VNLYLYVWVKVLSLAIRAMTHQMKLNCSSALPCNCFRVHALFLGCQDAGFQVDLFAFDI